MWELCYLMLSDFFFYLVVDRAVLKKVRVASLVTVSIWIFVNEYYSHIRCKVPLQVPFLHKSIHECAFSHGLQLPQQYPLIPRNFTKFSLQQYVETWHIFLSEYNRNNCHFLSQGTGSSFVKVKHAGYFISVRSRSDATETERSSSTQALERLLDYKLKEFVWIKIYQRKGTMKKTTLRFLNVI